MSRSPAGRVTAAHRLCNGLRRPCRTRRPPPRRVRPSGRPRAEPRPAARAAIGSYGGGTGVDLDRYFARTGWDGGREPTVATLRALQNAHVPAVPFENIDVVVGTVPSPEVADLEARIVAGARGGRTASNRTPCSPPSWSGWAEASPTTPGGWAPAPGRYGRAPTWSTSGSARPTRCWSRCRWSPARSGRGGAGGTGWFWRTRTAPCRCGCSRSGGTTGGGRWCPSPSTRRPRRTSASPTGTWPPTRARPTATSPWTAP